MRYRDRRHAGRLLAERLETFRSEEPVVLGLPRGGVPVADEVARGLGAPLDVIVVRKLGVPFQPELGMGALGEGGVRVLNHEMVAAAHVTEAELEAVARREQAVIDDRLTRYRGDRAPLPLAGRTVLLVDDGIATGGTARAAVQVARARGAARVVLAVPVAARDAVRALAELADDVVVLQTPEPFTAVGQWYEDFGQTSDDDVLAILRSHAALPADPPRDASPAAGERAAVDREVEIPAAGVSLAGRLTIPRDAIGVVLFAHGSGSSRHSPRNRSVAATLQRARLGTLLFDLLSEREADDRRAVFDIALLADRLRSATSWVTTRPEADGLPVGYFGASTGAAAALWAASAPDSPVVAVVSRGGRPDLAGERLGLVRAPTLLVVGGRDDLVLQLNEDAARHLRCPHRLAVVPGATHLFEEPGTLDAAAELARRWFATEFTRAHDTAARRWS